MNWYILYTAAFTELLMEVLYFQMILVHALILNTLYAG